MIQRYVAALAAASLLIATGCGGGGTGVNVTSVNPVSPSYSSLQFAVGTARMYTSIVPGLNVVSTFRQTDGDSATGVNTPKITGPFAILALAVPSNESSSGSGFPDPYTTAINNGPSYREHGGDAITGTPQTVAQGTPSCDSTGAVPAGFVHCPPGLSPNTTSFGQSGGVFAMGLQPANALASAGQPYSLQPYLQPFYSAGNATSTYQFIPYGGPPAFDPNGDGMGVRDGLYPAGSDQFGDPYYIGVGEGITAFGGVKISKGTYTLSVGVSTASSGGTSTSYVSKEAHLPSLAMLPPVATPVFHFDGNGGGSFTVAVPHGVSEAYVQIVDFGPQNGPKDGANSNPNCQGPRGTGFSPVYYTIEVTGPGTYKLGDLHGPNLDTTGGKNNLKPSPSICTAAQNTAKVGSSQPADDIVIQVIGFDYPIYEAAHGLIEATTPQNPRISNGAGRADITIGEAMEQDNGSTTQQPAIVSRTHAFHRPIRR